MKTVVLVSFFLLALASGCGDSSNSPQSVYSALKELCSDLKSTDLEKYNTELMNNFIYKDREYLRRLERAGQEELQASLTHDSIFLNFLLIALKEEIREDGLYKLTANGKKELAPLNSELMAIYFDQESIPFECIQFKEKKNFLIWAALQELSFQIGINDHLEDSPQEEELEYALENQMTSVDTEKETEEELRERKLKEKAENEAKEKERMRLHQIYLQNQVKIDREIRNLCEIRSFYNGLCLPQAQSSVLSCIVQLMNSDSHLELARRIEKDSQGETNCFQLWSYLDYQYRVCQKRSYIPEFEAIDPLTLEYKQFPATYICVSAPEACSVEKGQRGGRTECVTDYLDDDMQSCEFTSGSDLLNALDQSSKNCK